MNTTTPTIHDLQARVHKAAQRKSAPRRSSKKRLSRSARLYLIDILSRWGGSGLALIAGVAIFIAVSNGAAFPFRSGVWLLMMIAALYVCRHLRKGFRAGRTFSTTPFRWRANYTSALSVLSAAFGAGALITAPPGAVAGGVLQTSALILASVVGAGALHIAHGRSIVAIVGPASLFVIAAVWQASGAALALFGAGALVTAAAAGLFLASRQLQHHAAARFPRTAIVRREIDGRDDLAPALGGPAQAEAG